MSKQKQKRKQQRPFDYSRYHDRHVALRVAYLGAAYKGFASQSPDDLDTTVEACFFQALRKARLAEDPAKSDYARCGRTDKGVSALGQVLSIRLRCNSAVGLGVVVKETATAYWAAQKDNPNKKSSPAEEINYVDVINRVLPQDIRVLAWAPVAPEFNARFSCRHRTYKYYFISDAMHLENMRLALSKFEGEHDFRNFCKMDIAGGVTNFTRKMLTTSIESLAPSAAGGAPPDGRFHMCVATIVGQAFLWHQIRCMMAVLFMVGRGDESPEIVDQLLDIETNPKKPEYNIASDLPLVLFDCVYPGLHWVHQPQTHARLCQHMHNVWSEVAVRAVVVQEMIKHLDMGVVDAVAPDKLTDTQRTGPDTKTWGAVRHDHAPVVTEHQVEQGSHRPLLGRQTSETLEHKLAVHGRKLKRKAEELLHVETLQQQGAGPSV